MTTRHQARASGVRKLLRLVMADDLTFDAVGCYDNPDVHTPNMETELLRAGKGERAKEKNGTK